jgi:hypothetical protein
VRRRHTPWEPSAAPPARRNRRVRPAPLLRPGMVLEALAWLATAALAVVCSMLWMLM